MLITHIDLDHVSGVELVNDAKHIMVGKEEEWLSVNRRGFDIILNFSRMWI